MTRLCLAILLLLATSTSHAFKNLKTVYSWKAIDFAFPHEHARQLAITNGEFIPGASLPIDVDVYNGEKRSMVFVTTPRVQDGIPATLSYITDYVSPEGNPVLAPYPNWGYNVLGNCYSLVSVFRIKIDECERLWVLDTGKLGETKICPPKVLVFSLRTNKLITQYTFPQDQFKENSLFVTVAVDVRSMDRTCEDTFAYIADITGFSLVVYDYKYSRSWKIHNNLFYPYPPEGIFNIKGDTFDLMDGIIGLALSPVQRDGDRILYFHSLSSVVESKVSTSVIRNHSLFVENSDAASRSFVSFPRTRSSQSAAQDMTRNGVLFYGLLADLAIGCWNSRDYAEFGGPSNEILVIDPENLQFPSGLKIIRSKENKEELWALTSSFQKFAVGKLQSNETNFRIVAGFVDELVRGTKCDVANWSPKPRINYNAK